MGLIQARRVAAADDPGAVAEPLLLGAVPWGPAEYFPTGPPGPRVAAAAAGAAADAAQAEATAVAAEAADLGDAGRPPGNHPEDAAPVAAPGLMLPIAAGGAGEGEAREGEVVGFEVPRDALGRLVLGLLHTMLPGRLDDLQTPRVAGLVRQLRQRVTLALCCTVLTAPIAIWLLVRGVATYLVTDSPSSGGPLRIWLLGFLMLQLAWPICMPSLTLLLLGWCLGALLLMHEPANCTRIHDFLIEASALQTVQAALLLVAAIAALTARPLVQRLGELLNHSGTDPEIVTHILVVDPSDVPPEEECIICLSREDEDEVPWRQLACGHRFHQSCLLEWLKKARRCPVCRMDLHVAYRTASTSSAGSNAAEDEV